MPKKRHTKSKGKKTAMNIPLGQPDIPYPQEEQTASAPVVASFNEPIPSLVKDWMELYTAQMEVHSRIAKTLISNGYISLDSSESAFPQIRISSGCKQLLDNPMFDEIGNLLKLLQNSTNDSVDISTRSVTPPTKATASMQTSPSHSPARPETPLVDAQLVDESRLMDQTILGVPSQSKRITCKLNNEYDLSLEFMNRGNNSAMDIQTYLQEKLDVLDFLQQDHSSTSRREKLETSRLHLPMRTQEQPTSVSDWLNDTASSASVPPTGGFFIGTPSPSVAGIDSDDRTIQEVDAALLDDSDIRWETDSMISSASSPMRRARDRSGGSLFRHYRGRDRVSRLAANSLDFADEENSEIENSFLENTSVLGKSGVFGFGTGRWF